MASQSHDHTYPSAHQPVQLTLSGHPVIMVSSHLVQGQPFILNSMPAFLPTCAVHVITDQSQQTISGLVQNTSQHDHLNSSWSKKNGRKTKRRRRNKELEMLSMHKTITERRQQVMLENQWVPISQDILPTIPVSTVESPGIISADVNNTTPVPSTDDGATNRPAPVVPRATSVSLLTPVRSRPNPLPVFEWADSREMWVTMMAKEELKGYQRDKWWFGHHIALQPRLRSVLVDWLMEIAAEYCVRRETFHVAVDFIDRFMSNTTDVTKHELQLIGITALFVAAKVEEIRPIRVADLSYVTGDVCTETEILQQERTILSVLKWDLTPITVVSWVNLFLQTMSADRSKEKSQFMTPQYSQHLFIQVMRLLDLCVLDTGYLQFAYSVLAASAVFYMSGRQVALSVSGYQWTDLAPCIQWMATFVHVLEQTGPTTLKFFDRVSPSEAHTLQTHVINTETLELVHRIKRL